MKNAWTGCAFILLLLCLPAWAQQTPPILLTPTATPSGPMAPGSTPVPAVTAIAATAMTPSAAGTPVCDPTLIYVSNLCREPEAFRVIRTEEDWEQYVNDDEVVYPPPVDFNRQMLVIIPYWPDPNESPKRLGVSRACVLQDRIQIDCYLMDADVKPTAPRPGGRQRRGGRAKAIGVLLPPSSLPVTVLR